MQSTAVHDDSMHDAPPTRVAYQGEPGAFGHLAARMAVAGAEPVSAGTFDDVVRLVERGEATLGVIPMHNVIAGPIDAGVQALFRATGTAIVRHVSISVHLCVLGVTGATLDGVAELHSQDAALAQCSEFLRRHPHIVARRAHDTAGAARLVAEGRELRHAALASRDAAALYGLEILADGVQDRQDNATRFAVIAARGEDHA